MREREPPLTALRASSQNAGGSGFAWTVNYGDVITPEIIAPEVIEGGGGRGKGSDTDAF